MRSTPFEEKGVETLPRKIQVRGVGVSATSYEEVLAYTQRWVSEKRAAQREGKVAVERARYVCVTCVHSFLAALRDPEAGQALREADIVTPDGMPVVWALRSLGVPGQQRVYGPTLMLRLCAQAEKLGHRVFLYGGQPQTLEELVKRLRLKFPNLQIVGWFSPPFRPLTRREDAEITEYIRATDTDLLFVGLSSPKQDIWMWQHRSVLPGIVMFGVGAAFDFHSGRVPQAPVWMQNAGLEWLFRLIMEPRRLWRRYLLLTPRFLPLLASEIWRAKVSSRWSGPVKGGDAGCRGDRGE